MARYHQEIRAAGADRALHAAGPDRQPHRAPVQIIAADGWRGAAVACAAIGLAQLSGPAAQHAVAAAISIHRTGRRAEGRCRLEQARSSPSCGSTICIISTICAPKALPTGCMASRSDGAVAGENPPAAGNGWEPYPASLRIVNWIAWALAGNDLGPAALQSLAAQVRILGATLEYHLLGNHLLANAKALVFAGCFFSGDEADGWLRTGLDLLDAELAEQILDDGGHFELSPMYHAIILEDVLDLIQLGRIVSGAARREGQAWRALAARMLAWLDAMTHPDGEIGFFNDAAFGIARTHAELAEYGARLGVAPPARPSRLRRLAASGYARLQSGPFCGDFRCRRNRPVLFARPWPCRRALAGSLARRPAASDQWRHVVLRRSARCGTKSVRPPRMPRSKSTARIPRKSGRVFASDAARIRSMSRWQRRVA